MTMRYDPETGAELFTYEQVRQIVYECIDHLKTVRVGHELPLIAGRVHDPKPDESTSAA